MHYPHEREERKQLLSALVDNAQKDHFLISVAVVLFGILITASAILHSLLLHPHTTGSQLWLGFWSAAFFIGMLLIFVLPKLLPREPKRKLYGLKRSFIIKNTFPTLLMGIATFWAIGSQTSVSLPTAAALSGIFYALTLFSLTSFSLPSVKHLAISCSVISLALLVTLTRHNLSLDAQHIGNIILILNIGIPSIAIGGWHVIIRK